MIHSITNKKSIGFQLVLCIITILIFSFKMNDIKESMLSQSCQTAAGVPNEEFINGFKLRMFQNKELKLNSENQKACYNEGTGEDCSPCEIHGYYTAFQKKTDDD